MIREPAAADPIARILGAGGVEVRMLACEALSQIPSDEALRFLLGFVVADESDAVHQAAVDGLKRRSESRLVEPLVYTVARAAPPLRARAADAIAQLGLHEAVPALIANLRGVVYETVLVPEVREPRGFFVGTLIPYVAYLRPVIARGVATYDPVIGYVGAGGGASQAPETVLVPKTRREVVEQPFVLEALRRLSGEDFGYDQAAWRKWWYQVEQERQRQERARRRAAQADGSDAPAPPPARP